MRLSRRSAPLWEHLLLLAFTLLLLWPLCVGRALYWGDILLYFAPMLRFQQTALQHGHIPLWNPTILGGQPLVGNPQMGVFYPTTPLLLVMPVWLYLSVTTIIHVFLCGAFMNAYLRGWSGDRWARLAGSLAYMGSECLIGRIQFPPMIFSAPYFPLLLLCIDRCLDTGCLDTEGASRKSCRHSLQETCSSNCPTCHSPRIRRIREYIRLSLVVGLLALAAHPQMAYLILTAASLYAAARLLNRAYSRAEGSQFDDYQKGSRIRQLRAIISRALLSAARLILAGLLGLMLASVQILPAIQVLLESPREKLTPAQANRFYLEPAHLLRLIFPRFWGHPVTADFWGGGNAWEPAFFIGWLPLLLISAACLRFRKRRKVQFWIAAALGGVWLSFGNMGGIYWVAFKTVPGLSNFHDPARFLVFTTFAFALLTTLGWQVCEKIVWHKLKAFWIFNSSESSRTLLLQHAAWRNTYRCVGMVAIALPLWWVGKDWNPTVPHDFFRLRSRALVIAPVSAYTGTGEEVRKPDVEDNSNSLRSYLPAHEQFWKHYVTDGYSDYGPDDTRHFQAILDTMMPNLNTGWGQESASGYEPVPLSAPASVDTLGRVALRRGEPNLSRVLAVMGVRALILPHNDRISDPRLLETKPLVQSQPVQQVSNTPQPIQGGTRLPVRILQNEDVLPRAWIVRSVRRVEGKTRISAALAAPDFHPEQIAILYDAPDVLGRQMDWPQTPDTPGRMLKQAAASRITFLDAHTLEMEADCGLRPGFLVVSATGFPGWQAEVDTRPAPLHRADGSLMGLFLPPGKHIVVLRYKPACYQMGLYLSLLSVGTLSAMTAYLRIHTSKLAMSRIHP